MEQYQFPQFYFREIGAAPQNTEQLLLNHDKKLPFRPVSGMRRNSDRFGHALFQFFLVNFRNQHKITQRPFFRHDRGGFVIFNRRWNLEVL